MNDSTPSPLRSTEIRAKLEELSIALAEAGFESDHPSFVMWPHNAQFRVRIVVPKPEDPESSDVIILISAGSISVEDLLHDFTQKVEHFIREEAQTS